MDTVTENHPNPYAAGMQLSAPQLQAKLDALQTALESQPWWNSESGESASIQLDRVTKDLELLGRRWLSCRSGLEQAAASEYLFKGYFRVLVTALGLPCDTTPEQLILAVGDQHRQLAEARAQLRVMGAAMDRAASG